MIAYRGFYTTVQVHHVFCFPGVAGYRQIVVEFYSSHPSELQANFARFQEPPCPSQDVDGSHIQDVV